MSVTKVRQPGVDWTTGQIPFPAVQNPSSNANTLDDYEEGTWTPTDASGAGLSFTVGAATYFKIGRLVELFGYFTYPTTSNGANTLIGGLPYTVETNQNFYGDLVYLNSGGGTISLITIGTSATMVVATLVGGLVTNAVMSTAQIRFQFSYYASA